MLHTTAFPDASPVTSRSPTTSTAQIPASCTLLSNLWELTLAGETALRGCLVGSLLVDCGRLASNVVSCKPVWDHKSCVRDIDGVQANCVDKANPGLMLNAVVILSMTTAWLLRCVLSQSTRMFGVWGAYLGIPFYHLAIASARDHPNSITGINRVTSHFF